MGALFSQPAVSSAATNTYVTNTSTYGGAVTNATISTSVANANASSVITYGTNTGFSLQPSAQNMAYAAPPQNISGSSVQGVAPGQTMTYATPSTIVPPQGGCATFGQGVAPAQNLTYAAQGAAPAQN